MSGTRTRAVLGVLAVACAAVACARRRRSKQGAQCFSGEQSSSAVFFCGKQGVQSLLVTRVSSLLLQSSSAASKVSSLCWWPRPLLRVLGVWAIGHLNSAEAACARAQQQGASSARLTTLSHREHCILPACVSSELQILHNGLARLLAVPGLDLSRPRQVRHYDSWLAAPQPASSPAPLSPVTLSARGGLQLEDLDSSLARDPVRDPQASCAAETHFRGGCAACDTARWVLMLYAARRLRRGQAAGLGVKPALGPGWIELGGIDRPQPAAHWCRLRGVYTHAHACALGYAAR